MCRRLGETVEITMIREGLDPWRCGRGHDRRYLMRYGHPGI
jgi:hypothetical protein